MLTTDSHCLHPHRRRALAARFEGLADYEFVERLLFHAEGIISKEALG